MRIRFGCYLIAALLSAVPARADIILAADFVSATVGSAGNGLDVTLTNSGASALAIGGFDFTISTSNTNITFTGTDISTAFPYIFAGDSVFGPIINTLGAGQSMDGADFASSTLGNFIAAGATVGLGHVLFDVSPTAIPGSFSVLLATFPGSSLADPAGNNIAINTFTNGNITITSPTTVPEPASIVLFGSVLIAAILAKRGARRGAC